MAARRAGVVTFTGVLFIVVAAFNAIDGIIALAEPNHFFITEEGLVIDDFDAVGVVLLIIAGIQLIVGWGILQLSRVAQVFGIILAIISAITQFAHFTHYPAWAVIILVLDAVILYALTVYSDEFGTSRRRR